MHYQLETWIEFLRAELIILQRKLLLCIDAYELSRKAYDWLTFTTENSSCCHKYCNNYDCLRTRDFYNRIRRIEGKNLPIHIAPGLVDEALC